MARVLAHDAPGDDPGSGREAVPERRPGELFRAEAVAEQQDRWLGTVLLAPKVSHTVYTSFAAVVVAGVLGLFAFGEYTRKARIGGWLAPEQGLIHVVAPQPGVLTRVHAQEGLEVVAGTPLAVLSTERQSKVLGATQGEVVRQLRAQRDSLRAERGRHEGLFAQSAATLAQRLAVTEAEAGDLEREIALQRERLALAEREATRQRELRGRGIATEQNLLEAERDALDQAVALQALERDRTTLARVRLDLEAERRALPLREAMQLAAIDREVAALDQALAEAEAARETVIAAPEDGTVTGLRAASGSSVGTDAPLMTLVPAGARLEARLYGPSRAIGFVRPGQRVLMRYEAFPHQKFGRYEGVVKSVSRSTVGAAELGGDQATLEGIAPGEPVYRVAVELGSQTATAYGEQVALQPGMKLEADVLIETRHLYEWVLDPLHSLTGRSRA
jgi:membrane fusion protein